MREFRFTARRGDSWAPYWKVAVTRQGDEFVIASQGTGNIHATGHRDGLVHLTIEETDLGTQRFGSRRYNPTQWYPALNLALTPAACVIPTRPTRRMDHVTVLEHDEDSAFYRITYHPPGSTPAHPETCLPPGVAGAITLANDAVVLVGAGHGRLPPSAMKGEGTIFTGREGAKGYGVSGFGVLTDNGLVMIVGQRKGPLRPAPSA